MGNVYAPVLDTALIKTKVFTLNLAQAAATYDLLACNAGGGVMIESVQFFGTVVGATFTAVTCQSNNTVPEELLSAAEGAVVNIVAGKNIKNYSTPFYLAASKKLQYTISGSTGTGTVLAIVKYRPTVAGADIS